MADHKYGCPFHAHSTLYALRSTNGPTRVDASTPSAEHTQPRRVSRSKSTPTKNLIAPKLVWLLLWVFALNIGCNRTPDRPTDTRSTYQTAREHVQLSVQQGQQTSIYRARQLLRDRLHAVNTLNHAVEALFYNARTHIQTTRSPRGSPHDLQRSDSNQHALLKQLQTVRQQQKQLSTMITYPELGEELLHELFAVIEQSLHHTSDRKASTTTTFGTIKRCRELTDIFNTWTVFSKSFAKALSEKPVFYLLDSPP